MGEKGGGGPDMNSYEKLMVESDQAWFYFMIMIISVPISKKDWGGKGRTLVSLQTKIKNIKSYSININY